MSLGITLWTRKSMSRSLGFWLGPVDAKVKEGREVLRLGPGMAAICLARPGITRGVMTERTAAKIDATAPAARSMLGTVPLAAVAAGAFRMASQTIAFALTTIKTASRADT